MAKSTAVVPVNDSAAGKHHHAILFGKSEWQRFPVHQIPADCVSPTHMSPFDSEWIVLIKEVVFARIEDGPVGIVHPVSGGGEVELRTIGLSVEHCRNVIAAGSKRQHRRLEHSKCTSKLCMEKYYREHYGQQRKHPRRSEERRVGKE